MSAQIIDTPREAARKQTEIAETLGVRERRLRDAIEGVQIELARWSLAHPKALPEVRKAFMLQLATWASEDYAVELHVLLSRLNETSESPSE